MWFQYFNIPNETKPSWLGLCQDNGFAVVNSNGIPPPLSTGLLARCDTALVLRSGSLANGDDLVYIMANLNRADRGNIDQMPFGIAIISGSNFTSGVLVHHGNYDPMRTSSGSPVPRDYIALTPDQQTSFANNFSFCELPANATGALNELGISSQVNALDTLVTELRRQIPAGS